MAAGFAGVIDEETVKVWFMDSDGNVVSGFVSVKNLDEKFLLDEDIKDISFLPVAQGETAIGMMSLFLVNGSYPAAETDPQIVELADVKKKGLPNAPTWAQVMAARNRKTLVVCRECHKAIHNGTINKPLS